MAEARFASLVAALCLVDFELLAEELSLEELVVFVEPPVLVPVDLVAVLGVVVVVVVGVVVVLGVVVVVVVVVGVVAVLVPVVLVGASPASAARAVSVTLAALPFGELLELELLVSPSSSSS